jgi:hypothetical protein
MLVGACIHLVIVLEQAVCSTFAPTLGSVRMPMVTQALACLLYARAIAQSRHRCFRAWATARVLEQLCLAPFRRALFPILCFLAR